MNALSWGLYHWVFTLTGNVFSFVRVWTSEQSLLWNTARFKRTITQSGVTSYELSRVEER